SCNDEHQLLQGGERLRALVQAGDEIRDSDVYEARRRDGEYVRHVGEQIREQEIGQQPAHHRGETGQQVEKQGLGAAETTRQQDGEVTHLLWYFVRRHGKRGHHPEPDIGKKSGGDDDAVEEIMQAVTEQDQVSRRLFARVGMVVGLEIEGVVMTPEDQLLEHEEHQQPGEHGVADAVYVGHMGIQDGVWQEGEKRRAQHRTDGEAQQVRQYQTTPALRSEQEGTSRKRAQHTAEQAEEYDQGKGGHGWGQPPRSGASPASRRISTMLSWP